MKEPTVSLVGCRVRTEHLVKAELMSQMPLVRKGPHWFYCWQHSRPSLGDQGSNLFISARSTGLWSDFFWSQEHEVASREQMQITFGNTLF